MGEHVYLSEYCGPDKTAHVYYVRESKEFIVKCYQQSQIVDSRLFSSEFTADNFAETWVLGH